MAGARLWWTSFNLLRTWRLELLHGTHKPRNDTLRPMWQHGEGIAIGEVAGKPIRKQQRFDLPGSCPFPNSVCGDGPVLTGKWAEQLSWDDPFSNWLLFLQMSQVCKAAHRLSWAINKPYLSPLAPSLSALGKAFSRIQTNREISRASAGVGDRWAILRDVGGRIVPVWAGQDLGRGGLEYTWKLRPEMEPGSPTPFQSHSPTSGPLLYLFLLPKSVLFLGSHLECYPHPPSSLCWKSHFLEEICSGHLLPTATNSSSHLHSVLFLLRHLSSTNSQCH